MGKREAQFVTLRQLREEVGNDASRFFYLMRSHEQPLDFDLELAKSRTNENPVYYIQYAHARVASVMKQLLARGLTFDRAAGTGGDRSARRRPGAGAAAAPSRAIRRSSNRRRSTAPRTRWCTTCASSPTPSTPTTTPSSSSSRTPRCAMRAWRSCWACSRCCATACAARRVRPGEHVSARTMRAPGREPVAKLTARDYKGSQRRALKVRGCASSAMASWPALVLASVAFVYVYSRVHKSAESGDAPRPDPHRAAPPDPEASGPGSGKSPEKYDFYEMLPNFEVVVPEKDKDVKRDLPAAAKIERPGVYVLQAGSYRNEADAERVRAQLAQQGVDAKVQRVAVDADVWHRVRIGPISNLDELNKVRKQLQAAEVDALVIRVGD